MVGRHLTHITLAALISVVAVSGQALDPTVGIGIGIEQRLDEQVPLDLTFRDINGVEVRLADLMQQDRPVVLTLAYYECPMLCTQVLNGLLRSLRVLSLDVGEDFDIITVSIDPGETPALARAKRDEYVGRYGREGAAEGWHFLTGDADQIERLAESVGFGFEYDEETDLYVHASGIMVLTPGGRLARYFYGIEYSPKDLRFGLIEASENRIGSPVDQVLLLCFQYDPSTGKYGLVIMNTIRLAGVATVAAMAACVIGWIRRERRLQATAPSTPIPHRN
ncbi:MAG TPA: SCO family protein [Candidatus Latescibacteria bacterium]|jgi:protein SCO1/2|nr:SCO family protein [Candidatus Latescibacterota bacterium]